MLFENFQQKTTTKNKFFQNKTILNRKVLVRSFLNTVYICICNN